MQDSLSNLVDNLSGIDNKKSENKFTDTMRSMTDSRSQSIERLVEKHHEFIKKNQKIRS